MRKSWRKLVKMQWTSSSYTSKNIKLFSKRLNILLIMMNQKNKKNQIIMMLLNQLLLLTDKRQTLYILLHPHKDNQLAILNFQLKVPKDQSLKVNTCQSNHQLVKIEDFQFSKTMSHKDTRLTMQDQFNNLHLT
jgi:hypothetical protein